MSAEGRDDESSSVKHEAGSSNEGEDAKQENAPKTAADPQWVQFSSNDGINAPIHGRPVDSRDDE